MAAVGASVADGAAAFQCPLCDHWHWGNSRRAPVPDFPPEAVAVCRPWVGHLRVAMAAEWSPSAPTNAPWRVPDAGTGGTPALMHPGAKTPTATDRRASGREQASEWEEVATVGGGNHPVVHVARDEPARYLTLVIPADGVTHVGVWETVDGAQRVRRCRVPPAESGEVPALVAPLGAAAGSVDQPVPPGGRRSGLTG